MRIIDVEKANVETINCSYSDRTTLKDVQEWLDEQPTLTPESLVKRGRWFSRGRKWECSECDVAVNIDGTPPPALSR